MKVIKGQREKLEQEVIRLLVTSADSKKIDEGIARLDPKGNLKLVPKKPGTFPVKSVTDGE